MANIGIFERAARAAAQKHLDRLRMKVPSRIQENLPLARILLGGLLGGDGKDFKTDKMALMGGITAQRAREIFDAHSQIDFAKKNLWFVQIGDLTGDGVSFDHNMFCTGVSYSRALDGESVRIGSGAFGVVTGADLVEARFTTLDSRYGDIKKWFRERKSRAARPDGTQALPVDYLMTVRITHAFVEEDAEGNHGFDAHTELFLMRPGTMELDLSRREDGLEEIQFSLIQYDTFTDGQT